LQFQAPAQFFRNQPGQEEAEAFFVRDESAGLDAAFEVCHAAAGISLGNDADAIADLTRARDGLHDAKLAPQAAKARLVLADALWDRGSHAAGIAEAKAALAELDKPDELAQAREWLARHR